LGTTARLFLPASHVKTLTASLAPQKQPPEGGFEHVLVVEDDDAVRSIAVRLLRSLGYEVCEAGDPAAALAIIATGIPIDLLFTDVVLGPGMSGPALAGEVARRYPPIKLLFASGYGDVIPTAAGECTAVPVVTKPYTKGDLARWVRAVLDNRQLSPR
jgi:CheY-like chemotaxis protein